MFVPMLSVVADEVRRPGVTFTYDGYGNVIGQSPGVPNWGALADSLVLTAAGSVLLVVIGASLALIGSLLANRH